MEKLITEIIGNSGYIRLNNPKKGNALSVDMQQQFIQALEDFSNNPQVRIVVLTGNGNYFCTGMDLSSGNQANLRQELTSGKAANQTINLFMSLYHYQKPTIALLNGAALGGGVGLMFACDIRIGTKKGYFSFPEVRRGIVPATISTIIVPQIGSSVALDLMLTGRKISYQRACSLGFISEVVDDDRLEDTASTFINYLLSGGPSALRVIKEIVHHRDDYPTMEQNVEYVKEIFSQMFNAEAMHGIQSFAKREKPDWTQFYSPKL
eukprot:TRINITY_DN2243_c0_g2_i1.p1 TRINITY_DN2243_c0_g2~~TRINITY_DN2243_c0_g2_i1.p1  ORF type:complete len:265 (-),score=43.06 TRINITY_DN2243_c0_g2_i1:35-829(-)